MILHLPRLPLTGLMAKNFLETPSKSHLLHGELILPAVVVETREVPWDEEGLVVPMVETATVEEVVDSPVVVEDSRELETGNVPTHPVKT